MAKKGGMDLDSILDQALDDFEEIESAENAKKVLNRGSKQSGRKNEQKGNDLNKVGTESLSWFAFTSKNITTINPTVFNKGGQNDRGFRSSRLRWDTAVYATGSEWYISWNRNCRRLIRQVMDILTDLFWVRATYRISCHSTVATVVCIAGTIINANCSSTRRLIMWWTYEGLLFTIIQICKNVQRRKECWSISSRKYCRPRGDYIANQLKFECSASLATVSDDFRSLRSFVAHCKLLHYYVFLQPFQ